MSIMTIGLPANRTVFVSNVSEELTEESLKEFLSSFGTVEELIRIDGTGTAAIWKALYERESDAKHALLVHGTIIMGVPLEVKSDPSADPFGQQQAEHEAALNQSNGLIEYNGSGSDAVTLAAMSAAQAGVNMDGIPGAGITPDLVEMVKAQPDLANTVVPMLKANTNHTAAELGLLTMISAYHKQRATQEAELKQKEKEACMQRELDGYRAKEEENAKRRRKRRRPTTESSRSSTPDADRKESMTPPPPPQSVSGTYNPDTSYISETPTNHLYIVYPQGVKLPTLASVRGYFEACGELTDLKVSKSKNCIFASMAGVSQSTIEELKTKSELEKGQFNFALTPYPEYLAKEEKAESAPRKRDSRDGRRDRRDRDYDRRDRDRDYDRRSERRRRRSSSGRDRRRRR
eukprot:TRINITY_DN18976_c0_g1_i1.p1 TRINITY_DN18976_c0_g1~~TRINITY_DN18976_c0_g1_i1.p1  ORF type:complete len:426 (+),score=71.06 TRINITY_DN18976_c0_g1_i1:64-1278(+)